MSNNTQKLQAQSVVAYLQSFGSQLIYQGGSSGGCSNLKICKITSTQVAVAWKYGSGYYLNVQLLNISGTTLTAGNSGTPGETANSSNSILSLAAFGSSAIVMFYTTPTVDSYVHYTVFTISGTTITSGSSTSVS